MIDLDQESASLVKHGDEIFEGEYSDYPRDWYGLVGQERAKELLQMVTEAAIADKGALEHILLASGMPGVGKTTMAQILAYTAERGLLMVSGAITVDEARDLLLQMSDGDILFWDEFHLAVAGNKNRADWLLPFMTDGVLVTKKGREPMPRVTLVAATTEAGKLLPTLVSRFDHQPEITRYSIEEATLIVQQLARRMKFRLGFDPDYVPLPFAVKIAQASDLNPRMAKRILKTLRVMAKSRAQVKLSVALRHVGVTDDGLDRTQQDILCVLATATNRTLSEKSIQGALGEPGPLKFAEASLLQKGYIEITGQGRYLTDEGNRRAKLLVTERRTRT
jgi:Holliday junction resolvasome RuvABC ATP-dependent DNA helicase subunit